MFLRSDVTRYTLAATAVLAVAASPAAGQQQNQQPQNQQQAQNGPDCQGLPGHEPLMQALREVVAPGDSEANGGLGNHMWAVVVNRGGVICAVVRSGENFGDQWPGSRSIAAEKAYTANAFSLPNFALSTANLYWPTEPGQPLDGLETSNPVSTNALYSGAAGDWGSPNDPLVGARMGGITIFGGGLALYDANGRLVGGLGLSGDESCTDHVIAWKMRDRLGLDNVPAGVTEASNDNIIHDLTTDPASGQKESASGYGHPTCSPRAETIAKDFDQTHPVGADN